MQAILPGQRWLSETQPELGLGIVEAVEGRRVLIRFPATDETRRYALEDAPLARVELEPGEWIQDSRGRRLRIRAVQRDAGLLCYLCEDTAGESCVLPEQALDARIELLRPRQRLLAGRFDADQWLDLRYRAWQQGMREAQSPAFGLVGPRVRPLPHQLYVAAEAAGREAPRLLLADEVGLGKTIEAGLILHRRLLEGSARRVLILVPDALLHQWLVEMRRRFQLRLTLFDAERFAAAAEDNPFESAQQVLCGLGWLIAEPDAARAVVAADWDLLIVDEAHHLAWSEQGASAEYALVEQLAARIPALLLLTATPDQLGHVGHFGRLRLLDPARFRDYASFQAEEAGYGAIAALAGRLLDGEPLTAAGHACLTELLGPTEGLAPDAIIARLLDRHGTGRMVFRNRRAAIPGFPERRVTAYPLPEPAVYAAIADPLVRLTPEISQGADWVDLDPRVPWLIEQLRALRPAKVLLICAHARTVLELRTVLQRRAGIHAAVFHEDMEIIERDRAAAYFADDTEGAQILLCSEIGSEGRNFQFVQHLVLFDLPTDPDLLEQRIGRLDRIGQGATIWIHVPYLIGGPGERLFRWYAEGLDAFVGLCPAAALVYARLHDKLLRGLADAAAAEPLIAETGALTARLNLEVAAGRDRLLELHSHRPEVSAPLVAAIQAASADAALPAFMNDLWDAVGVEQDAATGLGLVLRPGAHLLWESFPELPEDGVTLTFDRETALIREDWEFLTWEHPMVREATERLISSGLGTAAFSLVRDPALPPGSLLLELLYVALCEAPPALQVGRFLPPTLLRLLLDPAGRDRAAEWPHERLRGQCQSQHADLIRALLQAHGDTLKGLLARGEGLAEAQARCLQTEAEARMITCLDAELDRLSALAKVNPSVRPDEIARLRERRAQRAQALRQTHLRLDAARIILARP